MKVALSYVYHADAYDDSINEQGNLLSDVTLPGFDAEAVITEVSYNGVTYPVANHEGALSTGPIPFSSETDGQPNNATITVYANGNFAINGDNLDGSHEQDLGSLLITVQGGGKTAELSAGFEIFDAGPVALDVSSVPDIVIMYPHTGESGQTALSDWSQFKKGGSMFTENSAWAASDPAGINGNQDYLFDVTTTHKDLNSYGNGIIGVWSSKLTLPEVPAIPGANGHYLYLKDCAEFSLAGTYDYDNAFMEQAFGLRVKTLGESEAKEKLNAILADTVGIESTSADHSDFVAYKDLFRQTYDWALVSTKVTSAGGEISFGWSFKGGDAKHGNDAAFWVLKDAATDKVIAGGLLAQGPDAANGIAHIPLPLLAEAQDYVVTIGQMNVGKYDGAQETANPHMLLGSVVRNNAVFAGDLLPGKGEILDSVTWNGETHSFAGAPADSSHRFEDGNGTLVVRADGTYYYLAADGKAPGEDFFAGGSYAANGEHNDFALRGALAEATVFFTDSGELIDRHIPVNASDNAEVALIRYNGKEFSFTDGADSLSIHTENGGVLEVARNGRYSYEETGVPGSVVKGADVTYVLKDVDGDVSEGRLHIGPAGSGDHAAVALRHASPLPGSPETEVSWDISPSARFPDDPGAGGLHHAGTLSVVDAFSALNDPGLEMGGFAERFATEGHALFHIDDTIASGLMHDLGAPDMLETLDTYLPAAAESGMPGEIPPNAAYPEQPVLTEHALMPEANPWNAEVFIQQILQNV